jgi:hypothetical protein
MGRAVMRMQRIGTRTHPRHQLSPSHFPPIVIDDSTAQVMESLLQELIGRACMVY